MKKMELSMKNYFTHELACCESTAIGANTRIWAFTHVLPQAVIGSDCNICDHVFVENDVVLGDRVTVKCGVQLWDGVRLEDDVFIGPNVTFTNDLFPRSKQYPQQYAVTTICQGASIGANATILPGITVGRQAMIGAGSVVTRSVPPYAIVVGNPARIVGYTNDDKKKDKFSFGDDRQPLAVGVYPSKVTDVTFHVMPKVVDIRGSLTVGEFEQHIPFPVRRYFMVFDVPSAETRGEHAHRCCHQFLICARGSVTVVADDGEKRQEFTLSEPNHGVFLHAGVWGIQYKYSEDAVLLVFASEHYDADDYIRNYDDFLDYKKLSH